MSIDPVFFTLDVTEMSHEALVVLILLAVLFVGCIVLWAIRKKTGAWADQYEKAAEDEARGMEGDYPVIGYRARRLSWKEVIFLLVFVSVILATAFYFSD